jgi:hypothetical protein
MAHSSLPRQWQSLQRTTGTTSAAGISPNVSTKSPSGMPYLSAIALAATTARIYVLIAFPPSAALVVSVSYYYLHVYCSWDGDFGIFGHCLYIINLEIPRIVIIPPAYFHAYIGFIKHKNFAYA